MSSCVCAHHLHELHGYLEYINTWIDSSTRPFIHACMNYHIRPFVHTHLSSCRHASTHVGMHVCGRGRLDFTLLSIDAGVLERLVEYDWNLFWLIECILAPKGLSSWASIHWYMREQQRVRFHRIRDYKQYYFHQYSASLSVFVGQRLRPDQRLDRGMTYTSMCGCKHKRPLVCAYHKHGLHVQACSVNHDEQHTQYIYIYTHTYICLSLYI